MKKIFSLLFLSGFTLVAFGQDFNKNLADARTAYAAGNLSNSRFAMEQMLHTLDAAIGKDILKLLPAKMDALAANVKTDNTTGTGTNSGLGLYVQRSYGTGAKTATVDIINNSPLITSLNTLLALPFIGRSGDGNQKVVKVQGYKAVLSKTENSETKKLDYDLQIPMQNTLVTFKMTEAQEADVLRLANTIPLEKIATMAQ
ncbi:hypothetical protein AHMF7605_17370 [Adhaeribacter arboris]|uniref:DUF3887 domain-containing protein n=1 Tax=Adhaeribacter arboris TaxID=2072846 RepID=A0A2T2YI09_9BACT|nr:hypothetical protein [Adhaeribacter arboris]PSR55149.1 hypothetical protein AHMF7605_17370 [Adhaeribacter arboris]